MTVAVVSCSSSSVWHGFKDRDLNHFKRILRKRRSSNRTCVTKIGDTIFSEHFLYICSIKKSPDSRDNQEKIKIPNFKDLEQSVLNSPPHLLPRLIDQYRGQLLEPLTNVHTKNAVARNRIENGARTPIDTDEGKFYLKIIFFFF